MVYRLKAIITYVKKAHRTSAVCLFYLYDGHTHHASKGGGQILPCCGGRGWYQKWGKESRELHPGDVVNIPAEVKD